jgi:hypothetical protein
MLSTVLVPSHISRKSLRIKEKLRIDPSHKAFYCQAYYYLLTLGAFEIRL